MATREKAKADKQPKGGNGATQSDPAKDAHVGEVKHDLPDKETCETVLAKMTLIRRFEERAGEMYAKAKIGGFLHLCIGEEATVVGAHPGAARHRLPASRPTASTARRSPAAPIRRPSWPSCSAA